MVHAQLLLDANISTNDKFMLWIKWDETNINFKYYGMPHKSFNFDEDFWDILGTRKYDGLWCNREDKVKDMENQRKLQFRSCKQQHQKRRLYQRQSQRYNNYKYRSKHKYHRW